MQALETGSQVAKFELAADAIVAGDTAALRRLLQHDPELIVARSGCEHRATLLHYIAANGLESERQRTPNNILEIATILLEAGAEVDAWANVYGGQATPLALVASSVHPEKAGVQRPLMGLLLKHGAALVPPAAGQQQHGLVVSCLANGRGQAAEFLADCGAPLDLEAAAGVGRLDVVRGFFDQEGRLRANATESQKQRGFLWACEYGHNPVVELLIQNGVDLQSPAGTGQTALHWAVVGGHLATIRLLLRKGAPLESVNTHGGTPLGQALWCTVNGDPAIPYAPIVATLLDAGAQIETGSLAWLLQQGSGSAAGKAAVAEALCARMPADCG